MAKVAYAPHGAKICCYSRMNYVQLNIYAPKTYTLRQNLTTLFCGMFRRDNQTD